MDVYYLVRERLYEVGRHESEEARKHYVLHLMLLEKREEVVRIIDPIIRHEVARHSETLGTLEHVSPLPVGDNARDPDPLLRMEGMEEMCDGFGI